MIEVAKERGVGIKYVCMYVCKGGGLLVYERNDVEVVRRPDLESPTIEYLRIEVCPPEIS